VNDIPVHIFIHIVEEAGAIRQLVATYIGPNGEGPVSVFMNDEDISPQTARRNLRKLGLGHLIERLPI